MLGVEGYQPVGNVVEEGKALHLGKTAEEQVGAVLLHVLHAAERCLYLLDALLLGTGIDDVLQRVFFYFFYSLRGDAEGVVLQQVRHYVVLHGLGIFLCIQCEDYLLLQFDQLLADVLCLQQSGGQFLLFRINS